MSGIKSITCPDCKRTSYNLNDIKHRYCGWCHRFMDPVVTFEVELRAFMGGAIRKVEVPRVQLREDANYCLSLVFVYGQNEIQPSEGLCSVSMGDVIRYKEDRYLILSIGFKKLGEGEEPPDIRSDPGEFLKVVFEPLEKKGSM